MAIALMAAAAPAIAADRPLYAESLRTLLSQAAAGHCAEAIMAEGLLKACREQMPRMTPTLAAQGPIRTITFVKVDGADATRVETYAVTFARGRTDLWHIGRLSGGKFQTAYSLGD